MFTEYSILIPLCQKYNTNLTEVRKWVSDGKILNYFENESNFCVLVEFKKGKSKRYQFQRFFTIGDKTHCSVDSSFDDNTAPTELSRLLNQKFE